MKQFAKVIIVFISLFIFICTNSATAASIRQIGPCSLKLSGEIDKTTDVDLAAAYKSMNNGQPEKCGLPMIILDSNGGDVQAAMKAGDFIRSKKFQANVGFDASSCASACVLLFLGGVSRSSDGKIGLHRPYSENIITSESEAKATYDGINRQIRQYLNRMNIPEGLLNIMNTVPPTEIKWMTERSNSNQLKELFIVGSDPVWEEQNDSLEAKQRKITKQELYSRRNRIHALCGGMFDDIFQGRPTWWPQDYDWNKCSEDVMNGRR